VPIKFGEITFDRIQNLYASIIMILTNTEPPDAGICMEDNSTKLFIDNDFKGIGTLYISER